MDGVNTAALNGFGRFGFGLFRAWFEDCDSPYEIAYINDDVLTATEIAGILKSDPIVTDFHNREITVVEDKLVIERETGITAEVLCTTGPVNKAPWIGIPKFVFESSGRPQNHEFSHQLIRGNTQNVIVGATVPQADNVLIMGYNHSSYNPESDQVISFGSCTAIPGVHIISVVKSLLNIESCSVNIVHSVPKWQLDAGKWTTIARKPCSLERVAPLVIETLSSSDIKVNYTYAPYYGVSLMDFEFKIGKPINEENFLSSFKNEVKQGGSRDIVSFTKRDEGAESYLSSRSSITIIESSFDVRADRVFFFGYFNNEGSGIRLHELAKFILSLES